ncbi:hypothetical protein T05_3928 [Trichinella murrelli]|uniref:Peptidase A2 domain-containing protein n=1 Tax=Trichinella murrelli TaxID=144512 RepID=A0A0V0T421_9BILA|nr:hypothetical protein T05_3928 [Trichinella murrelli]
MAHGEKGKKKLVNCLLDTGSERSFIRSDVADELDLQGPTRAMTVKGVNGLHSISLPERDQQPPFSLDLP